MRQIRAIEAQEEIIQTEGKDTSEPTNAMVGSHVGKGGIPLMGYRAPAPKEYRVEQYLHTISKTSKEKPTAVEMKKAEKESPSSEAARAVRKLVIRNPSLERIPIIPPETRLLEKVMDRNQNIVSEASVRRDVPVQMEHKGMMEELKPKETSVMERIFNRDRRQREGRQVTQEPKAGPDISRIITYSNETFSNKADNAEKFEWAYSGTQMEIADNAEEGLSPLNSIRHHNKADPLLSWGDNLDTPGIYDPANDKFAINKRTVRKEDRENENSPSYQAILGTIKKCLGDLADRAAYGAEQAVEEERGKHYLSQQLTGNACSKGLIAVVDCQRAVEKRRAAEKDLLQAETDRDTANQSLAEAENTIKDLNERNRKIQKDLESSNKDKSLVSKEGYTDKQEDIDRLHQEVIGLRETTRLSADDREKLVQENKRIVLDCNTKLRNTKRYQKERDDAKRTIREMQENDPDHVRITGQLNDITL
jgi:hypothetical protein